jgi:hypothetical protein
MFLRIRYPYHPLFGLEIEVFGAAGGLRDMMYVRLPNNTSRGIPAWMFDDAVCASIRSADQPTIECGALLRLCQLLDSHLEEMRNAAHDPSKTMRSGAADSRRAMPMPSAIEPSMYFPADARREPPKVRGAARGVASRGRNQKGPSQKGSK